MRYKLEAEFLSQQVQKNGYWLIQLKLAQFEAVPIGSRFIWQNNQAWLFQRQNIFITLLSDQEWDWLEPNQLFNLLMMPSGFEWSPSPNQLWLGSDLTQAAVFDAAKRWQQSPRPKGQFSALLHATEGFAFQPKPARFMLPLAPEAIGASPLLEDWGIPNRLASDQGLPGCFDGHLLPLFELWLEQHGAEHTTLYGWLAEEQVKQCQLRCNAYPAIQFQLQAL